MLDEIFRLQTELNDYVFAKNGLRNEAGRDLTMSAIMRAAAGDERGVNDPPNQWLLNYARAMREELNELDAELLWKWWSRDEIDLQNIRVELIDILHFLVSAMMSAGLTPDKVLDIYRQKHALNLRRQDQGYNRRDKTEDDTRAIT